MIHSFESLDIQSKNTFGISARCRRWIDFDTPQDLPVVFSSFPPGERWKMIGGGSNLLFTGDFDGVILHSRIKGVTISEENMTERSVMVRVGSGEVLDEVIEYLCERDVWGLENLSGIPGEAGAGAVQNVGAYGVEIKDCLHKVEVYDVERNEFMNLDVSECGYAYRYSMFKAPENQSRYIITYVTFKLSMLPMPKLGYGSLGSTFGHSQPSALEVRRAVIDTRREKLPEVGEFGSAGSYFKNPVVTEQLYEHIRSEMNSDIAIPHFAVDGGIKIPAAWLIDQCGWKGKVKGNAAVWHKQPLIIVNHTGDATSDDILTLEREIVESVERKFHVTLSPEVEKV